MGGLISAVAVRADQVPFRPIAEYTRDGLITVDESEDFSELWLVLA